MMDFERLKGLSDGIKKCSVCKLDGHVSGLIIGKSNEIDLVCVGDAPKSIDFEKATPFSDPAGLILRRLLQELGVQNYVLLNVLKCRPPGDRAPHAQEVKSCMTFLKQQIDVIQPRMILALGDTAHQTLKGLGIDHKKVYHPGYLLRNKTYSVDRYRSDLVNAMTVLFEKDPSSRPPQVPQIPQLHCHSDFSVGDSIRSPEEMAEVAADLGITHLALTDHGTMAGVFQFEAACKKHKVQPIIGYEGYVKEGGNESENSYVVSIGAVPYATDINQRPYWQINISLPGEQARLNLGRADEFSQEEAAALIPKKFDEWLNGKSKKAKELREAYSEISYELSGTQSEGAGKGHMTIWVRSAEGWKNLIHLHNDAVVNHFKRKPLIPVPHILEHSQGLSFGTACRGGLLFQKWIEDPAEAETWIVDTHAQILAAGGELAIEIMPHPALEQQHDFNRWAYALGLQYDIPVIVTCDSHYLMVEEREAKVAASSIAYRDRDLGRREDYFPGNSYYYQNQEEVIKNLGLAREEAVHVIKQTEEFAQGLTGFTLPREFPTPKDCVAHLNFEDIVADAFKDFVCRTSEEDLEKMGGFDALSDRVELEYNRITKSDFAWYFLIEYELCQRLDKAGILRGPGRGSASGSFISYIMDITRINPITEKLLFERFLPEGRKDPPDFDLDVQKSRRQEAIQILGDIVGRQTAQISTYARWHDKLKIRDACWLKRVSQESYEADRLSEEINLDIRALSDCLDGHVRHKGIHAAGVVALPDIMDTLPLTRVKKDGPGLAIELELKDILDLNIPKFDVLGLETLDYIAEMLKPRGMALPAAMKQLDNELHKLTDKDIADLLVFARLYPYGIFQLGTQAGEQLMQDVPPQYFEDVVRIVALNRPGTRPLIDLYKKRRIDGEAYEAMTGTEDSYGLIIYQEQVLKALNIIFGMSMQEADQARRAISKKKLDKLQALEEGTLKDQLQDPDKKKQWDEILLWAGYGFNRSHAVAYAWVSLMTIYLKILDPSRALGTWMNIKVEGAERRDILREAHKMGLPINRPDVNNLQLQTTGNNGEIQLGITCIKGIAEKTGQQLIDRMKSGKGLTDAKKKLMETTGCLDGREVSLQDYNLIPLPKYKTINPVQLGEMAVGEAMKAEVIIEAALNDGDFTVEDGSGIFRAKSQIPGLEEGFQRVLVLRGAFWYYIMEVLKAPVDDNGHPKGEQWQIAPVPAGEWKIGFIEGPTMSKKMNEYYRLTLYNDYEGHECICMIMPPKAQKDAAGNIIKPQKDEVKDYIDIETKLRKLRWGKTVTGHVSQSSSGGCFFHFGGREINPTLAAELFSQISGPRKRSKFDMPLEVYDED